MSFPERFIILQHNTVQVATKKPKELLEHIEKLIGTEKLAQEIDKIDLAIQENSKSKMESLMEVSRVDDQRELLKDKIKDFQSYVDLEKKYKVESNDYHSKLIKHRQNEVSDLKSEISNLDTEKENLESSLKDSKEKLLSKQEEHEQKEHNLKETKEKMLKLENSILDLNNQCEAKRIKVQENRDAIEKQKSDQVSVKNKIENLEEQKVKLTNKISELRMGLKQNPSNLVDGDQEAQILYNWSSFQTNPRFSHLKQKHVAFLEKEEKLEAISRLKNEIIRLENESKGLHSTSHQLELCQLKLKVDASKNIDKELQILRSELQYTENRAHSSNWHQKFLSEAALLCEKSSNIFGPLCTLGIVQEKYVKAVNSVLSSSFSSSIVVQNRCAALEAIDYFSKNRIGVISCLILDETDFKVTQTHSKMSELLSVIQTDAKFEKIFSNLTFNWYIATSKEEALQYSNEKGIRRNVVTLDGEIFYASGEIRKKSSSIPMMTSRGINRKMSTSKDDSVQLKSKIAELEQKFKDLRVDELESMIVQVSNKIHEIKERKSSFDRKIVDLGSQLKSLESSIVDMTQNELKELDSLTKTESELFDLYKTTKTYFFKSNESILDQMIQTESKMTRFDSRIQSLKTKLDSHVLIQPIQLEIPEKELNSLQKEHDLLRKQFQVQNRDFKTFDKDFNRQKLSHSKLREDLERVVNKIKNSSQKMIDLTSQITSFQQNFSLFESEELVSSQQLKQLEYNLKQLESQVSTAKSKVSIADVEKDQTLKTQQKKLAEKIDSLETSSSKLNQERFNLVSTRFDKFSEASVKINRFLSEIFSFIDPQSNCYLQFPEDRITFSEGVSLLCKTDKTWKSFSQLSGGQQALCACALSLSFQKIFPSPIFFYDEIDSSLDTYNTEKISQLLEQMQSQFICISLRPNMYQKANTLIGVYTLQNHSAICRKTFHQ